MQSRVSQIDWMGEVDHIQRDITRNNNILMESYVGGNLDTGRSGRGTLNTGREYAARDVSKNKDGYGSKRESSRPKDRDSNKTLNINKRRDLKQEQPSHKAKALKKQQATPKKSTAPEQIQVNNNYNSILELKEQIAHNQHQQHISPFDSWRGP